MNTLDTQGLYFTKDIDSIHFWKHQTVIYWVDGKITALPNKGNNND